MKKICHVVDRLNVGGLERTLLEIVSGLKGYEHHIWCLDSKGPLACEAEKSAAEVREFGFSGGISLGTIMTLASAMKKERFDIVHSHGLYPSIWARLAAIPARVPLRVDHVQNVYTQVPASARMKLKLLSYFTDRIMPYPRL